MNRLLKSLVPLLAIGLIAGCTGKGEEGPAVARVNGAPILLKDFKKEVSLAALRDPSTGINPETIKKLLETSIDRRLMIEQAVKLGLSQDERFLETIKTYWEQTLIRQLVETKTREWAEKMTVSDAEIKRYHDAMGSRITVRYVHNLTSEKASEIKAAFESGVQAQGAAVSGPMLIEDVRISESLYNAFSMDEGASSVFKDEDGLYSAVQVIKKEAMKTPPLQAQYQRIKAAILETKRQQALDDWLDEIKKRSNIVIDDKTLGRVADE